MVIFKNKHVLQNLGHFQKQTCSSKSGSFFKTINSSIKVLSPDLRHEVPDPLPLVVGHHPLEAAVVAGHVDAQFFKPHLQMNIRSWEDVEWISQQCSISCSGLPAEGEDIYNLHALNVITCLLIVQSPSMHLYLTSLPSTSLALPSSLLFWSPGR